MTRRFARFAIPFALTASLSLLGCGGPATPPAAPGTPTATAEAGHAEEGPHHGHLIELGAEEYHAELTHDDATKTVTIYLLDKSAKTPVPIADAELMLNLVVDGQPTQVRLAASPDAGDPAGQSSRFAVVDEKVLEALEAPKTTGKLNVTIAGKSYVGNVEHHEHGAAHKH